MVGDTSSGDVAWLRAVRDASGAALRWLVRSGIQHPSGGCHAWYLPAVGYEWLYPEVTGYFATVCGWASTWAPSGDQGLDCVTAASRALDWLRLVVDPSGGLPCLVPTGDGVAGSTTFRGKAARRYTFDAAIVLHALAIGAERLRGPGLRIETARSLAEWLRRHQRPDGSFVPFAGDPPWSSVAADWSTRPGCHHAKAALGLLAFAEVSGDLRYRSAAEASVAAVVAAQRPSGRFVTNPVSGSTHLHPHLYAAEATWAIGMALGDRELLDRATRATRWALDVSPPGSAARTWWPSPSQPAGALTDGRGRAGAVSVSVRADVLAQLLRLAVLTGLAGHAQRRALAETLLGYQERGGNPRSDGGFRFGSTAEGRPLHHVNVWATIFAVQALWLLVAATDASDAKANAFGWRDLA